MISRRRRRDLEHYFKHSDFLERPLTPFYFDKASRHVLGKYIQNGTFICYVYGLFYLLVFRFIALYLGRKIAKERPLLSDFLNKF